MDMFVIKFSLVLDEVGELFFGYLVYVFHELFYFSWRFIKIV